MNNEELRRLGEIARRLRRGPRGALVDIGDDAAVLQSGDRQLVVSVDAQVQGVHFRPGLLGWHDTGFRSLVSALSDLAAMGAEPRAALLALVLPDAFPDEQLYTLADGVAEASDLYRSPVLGGNLSRGGEVSITTAVVGEAPDGVLTRSGARPGDLVLVTGTLGDAALGLARLQAGLGAGAERFVERWQRPVARLGEGRRLLGRATAAIDISDGLLLDLDRVCEASRVGARIEADTLPVDEGFGRLAGELGLDPVQLALSGGEQYELLFTAPAGTGLQELGTPIGRIVAEPAGVEVVDQQGRSLEVAARGYGHW